MGVGGVGVGARLYGNANVTPKFHVLLHFVVFIKRLQRRGLPLPTCWPCERKHRLPKRWLTYTVDTSKRFDKAAFQDVLAYNLAQLAEADSYCTPGLKPPALSPSEDLLKNFLTPAFGVGRHFATSQCARANKFECVCVGDVVEGYVNGDTFCGQVQLLLQADADLAAVLQVWRCTKATEWSSEWDCSSPNTALVRLTDILCSLIYFKQEDTVVVLNSPRARR